MILRSVRRCFLLFVLLVVCVVLILLHRSRFLLGLLFEDGKGDAVFPSELLRPSSEMRWNETAVIPRIIHQTYKTTEIPEHWKEGQQAVRKLHPNWDYMVCFPPLSLPFYLIPTRLTKPWTRGRLIMVVLDRRPSPHLHLDQLPRLPPNLWFLLVP
jgi:hypothetical protein